MTTNLKNKAYQIIKERIMSCDYKPNTFLNEADLIEEIDASRTPIREALNKLEQEVFVQIIPNRPLKPASFWNHLSLTTI